MRSYKISILLFAFIGMLSVNVWACTNFLVTKGASNDGSTFISYAADSHVLFGELYFWSAADHEEGSALNVYEWDTGKLLGNIPQIAHTYNVVGNMNEYQLAIGETTYGGLSTLSMPRDGQIIDYGSLIYLTLQRAKNAREAIKTMTWLVEEYGYYSSGESFSIADKDEVWIMEMIGKGGSFQLSKTAAKELNQAIPADLMKSIAKTIVGKNFLSQRQLNDTITKTFAQVNPALSEDDLNKYIAAITEKTAKDWNNGAVWVARMIPDGYVSGHANQARITSFPWNDDAASISSEEMNKIFDENITTVYASDIMSFAKANGYINENITKENFSFSDTYAPVDFGGARFCEMRVWAWFNDISEGMDEYWDYAKGDIAHDEATHYSNNRMPLWVKPTNKITVHDVMNNMRNHLEDTELDMSQDIGAGPFGVPYRWRGLTWEVDGKRYCNERTTATQQTGFSFVSQSRSWLPDEIGGIIWFGLDDASSSVYTPIYTSSTRVPETFAVGNGDMMTYSDDAAFWVFNQVTNLAYTRYNAIHPEIEAKQQARENKYIAYSAGIDKAAQALYKQDKALAVEFLTDYSVNTANRLVMDWKDFYQYLFVKYMDGNIKTTQPIPDKYKYTTPKVEQPGYGENWYKKVVKETGEQFLMPEGGH